MNSTFRVKSILTVAFLFGVMLSSQVNAQWDPIKQVTNAARRAENSIRKEGGRLSDSVKRAHKLNYQVRIEFDSSGSRGIHYKLDGKPFLLSPKRNYTHKRTQIGSPTVSFDNGRGQSIRYSLKNGTYVFRWKNGVLNLFKK